MNTYHIMQQDIKTGKVGEELFTNYLNTNNIQYIDVRKEPDYMMLDVDYVINNENYDVKNTYKDDGNIIIETYFNMEPKFGLIRTGWFYNSWSEYFIFISQNNCYKLTNNQKLKNWFEKNKTNYHQSRNKPTYNNKTKRWWQGGYVRIPIEDIPKNLITKLY